MESTKETTAGKIRVSKKAIRCTTPTTVPSTSRYHMSCGSELARRRKRWSPYSRKGRSFLTKSMSLETLSSRMERVTEKCVSLNDAFITPNPVIETVLVDFDLDNDQIICDPLQHGSTFEEWSAFVVCARLMKVAWRKTRNALSEQIHRAESSELQAKSTMMHVFSMKSQLKDDICGMRERVKEINATSILLDELEDEKCRMLSENEFLKSKIDCLKDERDCLNRSITNVNQETEAQEERLEKLASQAIHYKEELTELKQMKASLDNTIREMITQAEIGEGELASLKTMCRNLELEVAEVERTLNDWNQRTVNAGLSLRNTESQSKAIRREIEIATEGGKIVRDELNELREKVVKRDSAILKLNEEVESTAAQLTAMKSRISISERNLWQRIRNFPLTDVIVLN